MLDIIFESILLFFFLCIMYGVMWWIKEPQDWNLKVPVIYAGLTTLILFFVKIYYYTL